MKTWFSYRYTRLTKASSAKANPFKSMLKALRKPSGPPRLVSVVQGYLSANIDTVNDIYEVRKHSPGLKGIALRVAIAKELLEAETPEVQEQWKKSAAKAHEMAQERHKQAKKGEPSDDPEDQEESVFCPCAQLRRTD